MDDLRKRILGCWLGKCIGGTLGGPWEGRPGPHALSFYDPVPDRMMPNDDLDLQVVWLEKLRETGGFVSPRVLAGATARLDVGEPASWRLCADLEFVPFECPPPEQKFPLASREPGEYDIMRFIRQRPSPAARQPPTTRPTRLPTP